MVRGSLGGRIWAVWFISGVFPEVSGFSKASEYFICADMMKKIESFLYFSYYLQQVEGPDDICLDKIIGSSNGSINMRLSREVANRINGIIFQDGGHDLPVADVRPDKNILIRK